MNNLPLYVSKRTFRSLGQEYRVYPDRLELRCWILFHTLIIPAVEIERVELRPSIFRGAKGITWGIKMDNADLFPHVLLTRKKGFFKRIAFTPDDPEKFVKVCQSILPVSLAHS